MRNFIPFFFILFTINTSSIYAQNQTAFGLVFVDNNKNGVFDKTDTRLSKVAVSSFDSIVLTNTKGEFSIPVNSRDIIFISKPKGFQSNIQENGIPQFYHILYQEKPVGQFDYDVIEPGQMPDTIFFPLYKTNDEKVFSAHFIGDIQAPNTAATEWFQELIVPELFKYPANFKVCLGDIADNNLSIYPTITGALKYLNTPTYMVFGNHDMNMKSIGNDNKAETFRKHFGPDYYSFNYGSTHFVVLNTVLYQGWNTNENINGKHSGGLTPRQLNWLKQDLKLASSNDRIVLLAHIPLLPGQCDSISIANVFSLLKNTKDIAAIFGHVHVTGSWKYSPETYWFNKGTFNGLVAGAACGGWWTGPFNNDSIPNALCSDGTPAGIFRFEFNNKQYSRQFIPGGEDPNFQMRISHPSYTIRGDSLNNQFVYVNVFDGNETTKVEYSINDNEYLPMEKTLELDPYMVRNKHLRATRKGWSPKLQPSSHLWKAPLSSNLLPGKHIIKANCTLSDGKKYSCIKIFEVLEK